jgi:SAM-dependent methyltransferase
MEQRDTFDAVADLYGEARPGYPAALYDDLWALADLERGAAVLEVGCGTGQATRDLAPRAGRVVALDPGERLIGRAQGSVPVAYDVSYRIGRFEEVEAERAAYDLVASAQAWHWVDPAVGFPKAAAALKSGGVLAVFGHVPGVPDEPVADTFRDIYDRFLPGAWGTPPGSAAYYRPDGIYAPLVGASGLFGPAAHRAYAWTWRLDPRTFGAYVRTDSSYHVLPEAPRFALFDALSDAIAAHGGVLDLPFETHLYVTRKL